MGGLTAPEIPVAAVGEKHIASISFVGRLDTTGELLTGTPTVTSTSTELTIDNKLVSTGALTINRVTVPAGKAVQCRVRGQTLLGSPYKLTAACGTNASSGYRKGYTWFRVDDE